MPVRGRERGRASTVVLVGLVIVVASLAGVWWLLGGDAPSEGAVAVLGARDVDSPQSMRVPEGSGDAPARMGVPAPAEPTAPRRLVVDDGVLVVEVFVAEGMPEPTPVVDAAVTLVVHAAPGTPRMTDGEGRVQIPRSALASAAITVRAPGCFPAVVGAESVARLGHDGLPLLVEVFPAYPLFGRVVSWPGSPPVPEGVAVLAWSTENRPTRDEVVALLETERGVRPARPLRAHERTLLLTRTKSGGDFRFPTPVRGGHWTVMAAGDGLLTYREAALRSMEKKPAVLYAMDAFSLAVRLTDHQGDPLPRLADVDALLVYAAGDGGGFDRPFNDVERLLLDVETPESWEPVHYADLLNEGAELEAVIVVWRPGFERQVDAQAIPSTRDGPVLHTLALTPTWDALGELTLELPGWGALVAGLAVVPTGRLDLTPLRTGNGRRDMTMALKDIVGDRVVFTELPHGVYSAEVSIGSSVSSKKDEESVEISNNPATLTFDLTTFGGLEVEVLRADGVPYDGQLQLRLEQDRGGDPHERISQVFKRPPYRESFVEAGPWTVRLRYADGDKEWSGYQTPAGPVDIAPGRWTRTTLVLRETP